MTIKPEIISFAFTAEDLEEALQAAVEHLRGVVEGDEGLRGFVVPELTQEAFEVQGGQWKRVFRFRAELLPVRR